jgi:hypothetical protein
MIASEWRGIAHIKTYCGYVLSEEEEIYLINKVVYICSMPMWLY